MRIRIDVGALEELLGHTFDDKGLVRSAVTHPSAAEGQPVSASYERLEFLGDSILGAMVSRDLFARYPGMDQGQLSQMKIALVSGPTLSAVASDLGLGEHIVFGESELGTGERGLRHALEDVFEACVGALYIDGGFDAAHDFIERTIYPLMTADLAWRSVPPKSRLQEVVQRDFHCAPEYKLEGRQGPAHDPTFTSVVLVRGRRVGRGDGTSKKESQAAAASNALVTLGYGPDGKRLGTDPALPDQDSHEEDPCT